MDVYIGTSGWMYTWNPDGFDWYINYSGLNSIELNSSFYRFPYPNQVKSWARKTPLDRVFRWSIKVHRSISHYRRLDMKAIDIMNKFINLFNPLDKYIDFYLIQLPPNLRCSERNLLRIKNFVERVNIPGRIAIEFRNESCFNESIVDFSNEAGFIYVSVDSPQTTYIAKSGGAIYLRMHGRTDWYMHYYTDDELNEIKDKILSLEPDKLYVYFNNDHDMLENARRFKKLFSGFESKTLDSFI